jgi:hypothetical protein
MMIELSTDQCRYIRNNCKQALDRLTTAGLKSGNSTSLFSICKVRHSSFDLGRHHLIQDQLSNYPKASVRCLTTNVDSTCYAFPVGEFSWRPVVFKQDSDVDILSLELLEYTLRDRYSSTGELTDAIMEGTELEIYGMRKVVLVSQSVAPSYRELLQLIYTT